MQHAIHTQYIQYFWIQCKNNFGVMNKTRNTYGCISLLDGFVTGYDGGSCLFLLEKNIDTICFSHDWRES